ncbi:HSGT1 protein [Coccidioides immitis RMSCC 3703]|uniref:HSGT1 protein n=1 Tax=Coccidioides immitis RMSCC 3703 TaxID=454286 RepID=A0A0J8R3X7_COCIT|nr:HSGT1 protein [Coccidioides immitis RMSCC 3703]
MAPMSQEDIEWFKSTFHPIPKPELPEDCVEYSLYCISGDATPGSEDEPVASRAALSKVQKAASELVKEYLRDYIWQREGFKLEQIKEDGVNLLRGRTEYGDSIEDEWVIVFLLRELTRKFHNLWVKVTDNDGEFLLVEAAASLPPWLEDPGIASNRVWIHRGELVIIGPPTTARAVGKKLTEKLAFRDARKIILNEPTRLMRSPTIEEEAFYRLRNYPDQITKNMHSSLATVPRTIAHLLHMKAAYVSPAVEAFYIRDPISLRVLQSNDQRPLFFDPTDLVTLSSDGEDKEASFDEEEFSRMMREMMGLPSTSSGMTAGPRRDARVEELESSDEENEKEASKQSSRPPQQTKPILKESEIMDSNRKLREELQNIRQGLSQEELDFSDEEVEIERNKHGHDDDGEDNDEELEEIQELSRQMEAELKKAGVLDPNRVLREESKRKNRSLKGKAPIRNIEDADTTDDDDHGDSDVDVNLARNLLESLRSQGGAAGPGSNLLGMMGMKMPKDDRGQ